MDGKNKERDVFMHKYSVTQIIKKKSPIQIQRGADEGASAQSINQRLMKQMQKQQTESIDNNLQGLFMFIAYKVETW